MATIPRVIVRDHGVISLGRQGENEVLQVVWSDIVPVWAEKYGAGKFQLAVKRNQDEEPYLAEIEIDGDDIIWTVTSAETAQIGDGECELVYVAGNSVAKSQTWATSVCRSLTGDGPTEPPDPYQSWMDEVLGATTKILSAVPEGGIKGQVLTKKSDASYDTVWATVQSGGGGGSDKNYIFTQAVASSAWTIRHGLAKFPSVVIVDSGNNVVIGDVEYIDSDTVVCHFSSAFSGKAYLN